MLRRRLAAASIAAALSMAWSAGPSADTGLHYDLSGEASCWALGALAESSDSWNIGARYIPALTAGAESGEGDLIESYIYLNAFAAGSSIEDYDNYDLDLYRLLIRYATQRTEIRVGLQKISFGPAILLRSLMWFDSMDPRDPQSLTTGVWAVRMRYDALDNSSLWLWGIYPDGERKGLEMIPSEEGYPELGGRYLRPVPAGEMAVSLNARRAEDPGTRIDTGEYRIGLEGKWDVEAGLWFEAVMQHQDADVIPMQWRKMLTLGLDYTFGIGNGLYTVIEHMGIFMSRGTWGSDDDYQTSAWMASYPIGVMDNISAIGYYSWEAEKYYQYAAWQRSWDDWILHISAFHYPETEASQGPFETVQPIMGTGGQILVIFNH